MKELSLHFTWLKLNIAADMDNPSDDIYVMLLVLHFGVVEHSVELVMGVYQR